MKINYDRPKLNSSSINKKKDFNQLNSIFKASTLPFYKKNWFIGSITLVSLLVLGFVFYQQQNDTTIESKKHKNNNTTEALVIEKTTENSSSYSEDTPSISPPSSKLSIPFKTYKIITNKAQSLALGHTKLTIPSNCFLDLNNNVISDSVILKIKMMNDPIDFILSGIPMEYDSADLTYTFESKGMFQIIGTDYKNNPIKIDKEKSLNISVKVPNNTKSYNFYQLDTLNNNWNFITNETLNKNETVFEADQTHSFNQEEWKLRYKEQNIANQKWSHAKNDIKRHKKAKPIAPIKASKLDETFTLDIDKEQFPELRSFSKQKFEPLSSNNIDKSIYKTEWNSIKLREHKKGISYQIILQNNSEIKTLIAKPVYEGKDWAKAQHLYSDKFAKYTAILDQKAEKELSLKEDYEKKKKHFDELDKIKNKTKSLVKSTSLTLVAPIVSFGIFNFDRPIISRPKSIIPPIKNIEIRKIEQPK